jgi:hypothetical protein
MNAGVFRLGNPFLRQMRYYLTKKWVRMGGKDQFQNGN